MHTNDSIIELFEWMNINDQDKKERKNVLTLGQSYGFLKVFETLFSSLIIHILSRVPPSSVYVSKFDHVVQTVGSASTVDFYINNEK